MQSKLIKRILFLAVMAAYLFVPYYMISAYDTILTEGTVYRFRPQPVDPYDAFRGKYITLYFMDSRVGYDTSEMRFQSGETVYVQVEKDTSGYAVFTRAFKDAPEEGDYLKTIVSYTNSMNAEIFSQTGMVNEEIVFDLPFERYYLPEDMAPKAEKLYFENLPRWGESNDSVFVDVRIKNGKALIEELYFQGIPVKEFIHRQEGKSNPNTSN